MSGRVSDGLPESNRVNIIQTKTRTVASGYSVNVCRTLASGYSVNVCRTTANKLRLGRWAVLAFRHPALQEQGVLTGQRPPYVTIQARVKIAANLNDGVASVDQTLRNALGLPFNAFGDLKDLSIYLFSARYGWLECVRNALSSCLGTRYLAFRCKSATVADMEKGYVRISTEALKTLGVQEADDVIVERPFAKYSPDGVVEAFRIAHIRVSAFGFSDSFLAQRIELQKEFPSRYPDAQAFLYNYDCFVRARCLDAMKKPTPRGLSVSEPDIPAIFMDYDARSFAVERYPGNYTADYLTPFMVRRSISSAVARESLQTGITFGIALINVTLAMTRGKPYLNEDIICALVISAAITVILLIARLRQQV